MPRAARWLLAKLVDQERASRRGDGPAETVGVVLGHLTAWTLAGVLPLAALLGFRQASSGVAASWLSEVAGLIVVGIGAYQFSRWKSMCLHLRSPLDFLMSTTSAAVRRAPFGPVFFTAAAVWAAAGR